MNETDRASNTYIVTTVIRDRRRILQSERNALIFIDTLQKYRREGRYLLHAYVVMPDHVHFLLTPQDIALERAVGMIKGASSHDIGLGSNLWQTGFNDHRCRDASEFISRKEYILTNPVRAGYVAEPHLFPFSSAYRGSRPSAAEAAISNAAGCQA